MSTSNRSRTVADVFVTSVAVIAIGAECLKCGRVGVHAAGRAVSEPPEQAATTTASRAIRVMRTQVRKLDIGRFSCVCRVWVVGTVRVLPLMRSPR